MVPWVCLQFVIAVVPDHTHLLFESKISLSDYALFLILRNNPNPCSVNVSTVPKINVAYVFVILTHMRKK